MESLHFWLSETWLHPVAAMDCWSKYSNSLLRSLIALAGTGLAEKLDIKTRSLAKQTWGLPPNFASHVIHLDLDQGGLGVPSLLHLHHALNIKLWASALNHPNHWISGAARTHFNLNATARIPPTAMWVSYCGSLQFFGSGIPFSGLNVAEDILSHLEVIPPFLYNVLQERLVRGPGWFRRWGCVSNLTKSSVTDWR